MTIVRRAGVCWWVAGLIAGAFGLGGCADPGDDDELAVAENAVETVTIDPRRSLVVTEETILARFSFARVMDQLVEQSDVPGLTSLALFQQWWDTQNPNPGVTDGPHCDDTLDDHGQSLLNGFPYTCRPAPLEGGQAAVDPFLNPGTNPDEYIPIGLFNRFDMTPFDGSHCGEYRIVYARRAGIAQSRQRNLIIFEATLANPHPQQGLKGCRKIAKFWTDLSANNSITDRAAKLEQFYFAGIPSVAPVVHVEHYGGSPTGLGQVRTNQFIHELIEPRVWSLREFKLIRTCVADSCTAMRMVPATVKGNPFGPLFDPASTRPEVAAFVPDLASQVAALAAPSVAGIDRNLADAFNNGQSQASGSLENNYVAYFGSGPGALRTAIDDQLDGLDSTLTAANIVARAQALSCAGCHRLSNLADLGGGLIWPPSLGFTHVTERQTETVDGQVRFVISDALIQAFLPKRKQVLEDYINERPYQPGGPKDPIGGKRVH